MNTLHKYSSVMLALILAISVTACSLQTDSSSSHMQSNAQDLSEQTSQPFFSETYSCNLPPNIVLLEWLSDHLIIWVTENQDADNTIYKFFVFDVLAGTETPIFEKSVESAHALDVAVTSAEDLLHLYLCDSSDQPIYSKITFQTSDWKVISEDILSFPQYISWPQMSSKEMVLSQDIKSDMRWEFVLWPLNSPQDAHPLKQSNDTRYDFTGAIWSSSGNYFMLANLDALGMAQFESMGDLLAFPKEEWPAALQYDVFSQDGNFVFSFTVDFLHREDGSESGFNLYWVADDQIYVASTFYDATQDKMHSKDQVIDNTGTVVYERAYEGDPSYLSAGNFQNGGVYYIETRDGAVHLMYLSFLTEETIDCGSVADGDDWESTFMCVSPKGSFMFLQDSRNATLHVFALPQ